MYSNEGFEMEDDFDFQSTNLEKTKIEGSETKQPIQKPYKSLGIPSSRIQNLDSLKEELTCACCLLIVWEPVCCGACETHFCNICIVEWLKSSVSCPVCQSEFDSHQIPRISRNLLSKLKVSCIYSENGCSCPLDYKDVYQHQEHCEYRKERCLNQDCDLEMTVLEMKIHREECPHLVVACQFCKNLLKNRDRENHEAECPYRTILCCYESCGKTLKAMDYDRHLEDCDYRPFECEYCKKTVIKLELEDHHAKCEEKPLNCRGCGMGLKLKDLVIHEEGCELIEITCNTCDQTFLRKDREAHDRLTCVEAGLQLLRKVLSKGISNDNSEKKGFFVENNRLELFQKRLEHQSTEIANLKKELLSLQMANLTDTKSSVYSLQYPDISHKYITLASASLSNPLLRKISSVDMKPMKKHNFTFFQDIRLAPPKTAVLVSPENISVKKHNYLSMTVLNEVLALFGDDLGRLTLWDLAEEKELACLTVISGVEIKAISLFSYDNGVNIEDLYGFLPRTEKTSLSLLGYWAITGHASGDLFIWDIDLNAINSMNILKKVSQMHGNSNNKISSILDLEDQTHFITASYGKNNQIDVWDCLNDVKVYSIEKPHKDTISKLALLEKRNRFVSGSDDGTVKIWRMIRGPQPQNSSKILSWQCEKTLVASEPIWSLAVYGEKLVLALNNCNIEIYDLMTKEREKKLELTEEFSGGLVGDILVVEVKTEEEEKNEDENKGILIIALHKDRVCVYDNDLRCLAIVKQNQNEFKWGFLASHLMQILVARKLREGGNLVKFAVLGQKGKKVSLVELTVF